MNTVSIFFVAAIVLGCSSSSDTTGGTQDSSPSESGGGDARADSTPSETSSETSADTGGDSTTTGCGGKTCEAGQICRRTYTTGGVCKPCGDGGTCDPGEHCSGSCCVPDVPSYSYGCFPRPSSCADTLACGGACGDALCGVPGGCPCESASGDMVTCHCLAP